jgi:hypothetical protein
MLLNLDNEKEVRPFGFIGVFLFIFFAMEFKRYFQENYFVSRCGIVKNGKGVIMSPKDYDGYLYYRLTIDGKKKDVSAHRIVMCAWEPTVYFITLQINHKDLNKHNNHLDNLEWCTAKENVKHYHLNKNKK